MEIETLANIASDVTLSIVLLYLYMKCEARRVVVSDRHLEDLREFLSYTTRTQGSRIGQEETD